MRAGAARCTGRRRPRSPAAPAPGPASSPTGRGSRPSSRGRGAAAQVRCRDRDRSSARRRGSSSRPARPRGSRSASSTSRRRRSFPVVAPDGRSGSRPSASSPSDGFARNSVMSQSRRCAPCRGISPKRATSRGAEVRLTPRTARRARCCCPNRADAAPGESVRTAAAHERAAPRLEPGPQPCQFTVDVPAHSWQVAIATPSSCGGGLHHSGLE